MSATSTAGDRDGRAGRYAFSPFDRRSLFSRLRRSSRNRSPIISGAGQIKRGLNESRARIRGASDSAGHDAVRMPQHRHRAVYIAARPGDSQARSGRFFRPAQAAIAHRDGRLPPPRTDAACFGSARAGNRRLRHRSWKAPLILSPVGTAGHGWRECSRCRPPFAR